MKVKNRSPRGAVPGGLFGGRRCLANARQLGQRCQPLRVERGLDFALLGGGEGGVFLLEQGLLTRKAHELVAVGVLVGRGCGHVMVGIKAFWQ